MDLTRMKVMDQALRHITTAVSTAKLYSPGHQQVVWLAKQSHGCLMEALAGDAAISLKRVDEQLAIEGYPLTRTMYIDRFARLIKQRGIGHLKFCQGLTDREIHDLVAALAGTEKVIESSANVRLGQVEVRHVSGDREVGNRIVLEKSAGVLADISNEELARVMEVYEAVRSNRRLQVVGLSEIVAGFIDIFADYADPMLTLVPLRSMDEYTFTHSLNVCLLNLAQATALGISGPLLHDIGLSAMLHDVGKLFVPAEVLNKSEPLDEREWKLMREHPVRGAEYLLDTPGVPRMAVVNAYEHHIRYDLRGYPHVREKWEQNLCSQMTTISDIFDALSTRRPYREPLDPEAVRINIEQLIGSQLHPVLAENFLKLMKKVLPGEEE